MKQMEIQIPVECADVNGFEMGVTHEAAAYMSASALARFCGVSPSTLANYAQAWEVQDAASPFVAWMTGKFERRSLYVPLRHNKRAIYAYLDDACALVLEYFAFEHPNRPEAALANYRRFSRAGVRAFIYAALGYSNEVPVPPKWRPYHDRLELNPIPNGYFSVFREMSEFLLFAIQNKLVVDSHTVPDVSVGGHWSKYWNAEDLTAEYGERVSYPHKYPDYFPQAAANGVIEAWIYPNEALGQFRNWFHAVYLPRHFPSYLNTKVKKNAIRSEHAKQLLEALASNALEPGEDAKPPQLPFPEKKGGR